MDLGGARRPGNQVGFRDIGVQGFMPGVDAAVDQGDGYAMAVALPRGKAGA